MCVWVCVCMRCNSVRVRLTIAALPDVVTGTGFVCVSLAASRVSVAKAVALATLGSWDWFAPDVQAWQHAV